MIRATWTMTEGRPLPHACTAAGSTGECHENVDSFGFRIVCAGVVMTDAKCTAIGGVQEALHSAVLCSRSCFPSPVSPGVRCRRGYCDKRFLLCWLAKALRRPGMAKRLDQLHSRSLFWTTGPLFCLLSIVSQPMGKLN